MGEEKITEMKGSVFVVLAVFASLAAAGCDMVAANACGDCASTLTVPEGCKCARDWMECLRASECMKEPAYFAAFNRHISYISYNCPYDCFHEETPIVMKGKTYHLDDLQKNHPQCAVPHVVEAIGVIVTAKCSSEIKKLRVTRNHLVYTNQGLKSAGKLALADTLYEDHDESKPCSLISVEEEQKAEKYFGLNCYSNDVIASGLKCSTFEKYHGLASLYFKTIGRIIGVHHASKIGDKVYQLARALNLIRHY